MVEQTVVVPRMRRVPSSVWALREAFEAAPQAQVALSRAIQAADRHVFSPLQTAEEREKYRRLAQEGTQAGEVEMNRAHACKLSRAYLCMTTLHRVETDYLTLASQISE